jgi:predicted cobalt transporter CbtA
VVARLIDPARPRSVVVGAVAAGALAGLVAALVLRVTAEPVIDQAIRLERARAAASAEPAIVTRNTQKGVGLFAGYALAGIADGLLFAVGFLVVTRGRPRGGDTFRAAVVAGGVLAGALVISPWLKYPPNPPGVGDPATLHRRQLLYVAAIALAFVVLAAAARLSTLLRRRGWSDARRVACLAAGVAVDLGLIFALLPPPPDPVTVPATLLWRFRVASLAGNLVLWAALTLGFALVADATVQGSRAPLPATAAP